MKSCNIKQIPLMNPVFDKEMEDAALYALRNKHYVLGDDVRKFEEEFSARVHNRLCCEYRTETNKRPMDKTSG
jgi:dTDP-4-amino-4,6-dideoxygalactose transaminase